MSRNGELHIGKRVGIAVLSTLGAMALLGQIHPIQHYNLHKAKGEAREVTQSVADTAARLALDPTIKKTKSDGDVTYYSDQKINDNTVTLKTHKYVSDGKSLTQYILKEQGDDKTTNNPVLEVVYGTPDETGTVPFSQYSSAKGVETVKHHGDDLYIHDPDQLQTDVTFAKGELDQLIHHD